MQNHERGATSQEKTQYYGVASIQNEEHAGRERNEMASIKLWRSINFYYIKLY